MNLPICTIRGNAPCQQGRRAAGPVRLSLRHPSSGALNMKRPPYDAEIYYEIDGHGGLSYPASLS